MRQLTLIDMRPICPGCKQPASFLAQWSPGDKSYLCKKCTLQWGNPDDLFVLHDNSVGVGLQQGIEYAPQRQRYQSMAESLFQLRRGCSLTLSEWTEAHGLPCERDRQARPGCKRCLNLLRYDTQVEQAARKVAAERGSNPELAVALGNRYSIMAARAYRPSYNLSFPLCRRCGQLHDRKSISGDARVYCQHCDDELEVESYLKNKGIFEDPEDDEAILDKLHRLRRELFDRGVLPDYWYTTKEKLNAI
jgi:hypothetical protein